MSEGTPPFAYLGWVGVFGMGITLIGFLASTEFLIFTQPISLSFLYELPLQLCSTLNVVSVILFVKLYGATPYSLISLCGVLYSMLFDIFIFNRPFKYLVIIGYSLIILGVVLFHLQNPRKLPPPGLSVDRGDSTAVIIDEAAEKETPERE